MLHGNRWAVELPTANNACELNTEKRAIKYYYLVFGLRQGANGDDKMECFKFEVAGTHVTTCHAFRARTSTIELPSD
jgi:hypothetical protein